MIVYGVYKAHSRTRAFYGARLEQADAERKVKECGETFGDPGLYYWQPITVANVHKAYDLLIPADREKLHDQYDKAIDEECTRG